MQAASGLVAVWAIVILGWDFAKRRIPNVLSIGVAFIAIIFLMATGKTVLEQNWLSAAMGAGLGLLFTLPGYGARILGAGDVKLMFTIGLVGGWQSVLKSFIAASLMSGIAALLWLTVLHYMGRTVSTQRVLPFGAALAIGLLVSMGLNTHAVLGF